MDGYALHDQYQFISIHSDIKTGITCRPSRLGLHLMKQMIQDLERFLLSVQVWYVGMLFVTTGVLFLVCVPYVLQVCCVDWG